MRDLFDTQMEITDQLCDQGSPLFAPMGDHAILAQVSMRAAVAESLMPARKWMKVYPDATEKQRLTYYRSIADPDKNERGHVYCDHWHNEALRILNLK